MIRGKARDVESKREKEKGDRRKEKARDWERRRGERIMEGDERVDEERDEEENKNGRGGEREDKRKGR